MVKNWLHQKNFRLNLNTNKIMYKNKKYGTCTLNCWECKVCSQWEWLLSSFHSSCDLACHIEFIIAYNLLHRHLRIGSWNVRSANSVGFWKILTIELSKFRIDIAAIQEMKARWLNVFVTGDYRIINSPMVGGNSGGVAFLVHKRLWKTIGGWDQVSIRLVILKMASHGGVILLVCW